MTVFSLYLIRYLRYVLNVSKCQSMSFYRSKNVIVHNYTINDTVLESVTSKKDLGVLLTSNLNYHSHIQSMGCKAYKMLGFIRRVSSDFKLSSSLKTLYCSLVRSLLEYACILWDPYTASDSLIIERVQRLFLYFAGRVLKINHPVHDYTPVLRELCRETEELM